MKRLLSVTLSVNDIYRREPPTPVCFKKLSNPTIEWYRMSGKSAKGDDSHRNSSSMPFCHILSLPNQLVILVDGWFCIWTTTLRIARDRPLEILKKIELQRVRIRHSRRAWHPPISFSSVH
jgi:hypothetical protein